MHADRGAGVCNHQHLLVRDNRGVFPEFLAHLHQMIAKSLNVHWQRHENFWAPGQPSAVYLVESGDRFDKLVYLLANPVTDHLVEHVADWPGASSFSLHLSGREKTVKRPTRFFRQNGPMPEQVTLRLERPDGFEELSEAAWRDKISTAVRAAEEKARARRTLDRTRVLGRKAVLRAKPTDRPDTVAPRGGLRPLLACHRRERRDTELRAVLGFREAYRAARKRWCAGFRDAIFPPGTSRMRRFGVQCAPVSAPVPLPLSSNEEPTLRYPRAAS